MNWTQKNVTETDNKLCNDWLIGKHENHLKNITRVITISDTDKTPYTKYRRYKVDTIDKHTLNN